MKFFYHHLEFTLGHVDSMALYSRPGFLSQPGSAFILFHNSLDKSNPIEELLNRIVHAGQVDLLQRIIHCLQDIQNPIIINFDFCRQVVCFTVFVLQVAVGAGKSNS